MSSQPLYVTDTHSLIWYLAASPRLSPAAKRPFDQAHAGSPKIIVPIIVMAELVFLIEKGRVKADADQIVARIAGDPNYEISPLEVEHILCLKEQTTVSEMHDRLLVCEALKHDAKLITKDEEVAAADVVDVIW